MSRATPRTPSRLSSGFDHALDWAMRVVPVAALIAVAAFFTAQQTVKPHHRAIKAVVLMALMALMVRFDMVYSVYLFALLFVFPSGISIGSSNSVLMTIIPLIWAVRATSSKIPLMRRSALDAPIALFLLAHVVSLGNVSEVAMLTKSIGVIWRQVSACAFFYCIFMFVDTEEKLYRLGRIMCVACLLVMSTAVMELFAPGTEIIPGWIGLTSRLGEGEFKYRIEGLRVGGAFESHGMLADFGTQLVLFMVFFAYFARNIIEKAFWLVAVAITVTAILATANRGATAGFGLGLLLLLLHFRRRLGVVRSVAIAVGTVVVVMAADAFLSEKTIAVSVFDRFGATQFEGMVPDTRTMTWKPALLGALEKPFVGHGPYYDTGVGLTKRYWPHNGYLFFFYTLGLLGLGAFLWVAWRVYRQSRRCRHPALRGTRLGTFMALAQIWLFVLLFEQLRTDHQRDDIYPYIVWMCFGVVFAGAAIGQRRIAETGGALSGPPR